MTFTLTIKALIKNLKYLKNKKDEFISKINNLNERPIHYQFHGRILEYIRDNVSKLYHGYTQRLRNYIFTKLNYKKIFFKFTKDRKMVDKEFLLKKDTFIAHGGIY